MRLFPVLMPIALWLPAVLCTRAGAQEKTPAEPTPPLEAALKALKLTYDIQGQAPHLAYLVPYLAERALDVERRKDWTARVFELADDRERWVRVGCTVLDLEREYVFAKSVLGRVLRWNHRHPGVRFVVDHEFGDLDAVTDFPLSDLTPERLQGALQRVVGACDDEYAALKRLIDRHPGRQASADEEDPYREHPPGQASESSTAVLADLVRTLNLPHESRGAEGREIFLFPFESRGGEASQPWTVRVQYVNAARRHVRVSAVLLDKPERYVFSKKVLADALRLNAEYAGAMTLLDEAFGDLELARDLDAESLTAETLRRAILDVAGACDEHAPAFRAADAEFPGRESE